MRKVVAAMSVVLLAFGVAMADEFGGVIKKVDGNKVTIEKRKKGMEKGEKGEEVTLTADAKVKVVKGKFDKETKKVVAGDAIEGGLKNELFSKEGVFVGVTTEGDKITEIRVFAPRKKKDN